MSQNHQVFCRRCQKPITTQSSLIVGEAKREIFPFHYKCFEEESYDPDSKIKGLLHNLHEPNKSPILGFWIGLIAFIFFFGIFLLGAIVAPPYTQIGWEIFIFVIMAGVSAWTSSYYYHRIKTMKALVGKSKDLYLNKLPE